MINIKKVVVTTLVLYNCYGGIAPNRLLASTPDNPSRANGHLTPFCFRRLPGSAPFAVWTFQPNSGLRLFGYDFTVRAFPSFAVVAINRAGIVGGTTGEVSSEPIPIPDGTTSVGVNGGTLTSAGFAVTNGAVIRPCA